MTPYSVYWQEDLIVRCNLQGEVMAMTRMNWREYDKTNAMTVLDYSFAKSILDDCVTSSY